MKSKRFALLFSSIIVLICFALLYKGAGEPTTRSEGSAHLEYIYGTITKVKNESLLMRVSKEITDDAFIPKVGDNLHLFVPLETIQSEVIPHFAVGDEIAVSVYSFENIHLDNGLYSLVIMSPTQIRKTTD